jgi:cytochrome c
MDGFELNKIMGAVLGTLLVVLGVNIVAGGIFAPEKPAKAGFEIAVTEAPKAGAEKPAPEVPIEQLLASADVKKGETVSKKCHVCHNFEKGGGRKVGPDLYGVVGRERASVAGFPYSDAMKADKGKWTIQELNHFLTDPRKAIPGTAMAFAGLSKPTDRANILAYLNTLSDNPQPLPTAAPAAAPKEGAAPQGGEAPKATPAPAGNAPAPAAPAKQ